MQKKKMLALLTAGILSMSMLVGCGSKKANEEAAKAKSDALNAARDQVADISVAIAEKVIAKNLSAEDQKDLVDQFIKGLDD